jgi:hypothetical protein
VIQNKMADQRYLAATELKPSLISTVRRTAASTPSGFTARTVDNLYVCFFCNKHETMAC